MTEHRPAASLTSSLLARRGDARPAMRRQPMTNLGAPMPLHEDLGWNDIGQDEPPVTSLAAMTSPESSVKVPEPVAKAPEILAESAPVSPAPKVQSPVNRQLEAIAKRIHEQRAEQRAEQTFKPMLPRKAPRIAPPPVAAEPEVGTARKAAFTLRLDPERHLRLRLLSAVSRRSAQMLLIEALDALLARHEKVEDLAGQVETGVDVGSVDHDHKKQA